MEGYEPRGVAMNVNLSLPDDLAQGIESKVASGRFGYAADVVREACKLEALRAAWR